MSNDLLAGKKLVCVTEIPVRWGDMDAMRHVNNVTFFRYMEQARIEWYGDIRGKLAGVETAVVSNFCNYHAPLSYPGTIEIRTYAGNAGRSSFKIVQEMRRTDDPDTLIAVGGTTVVWVDPATGKSTPIPDVIRAMME